MDKKYQVVNGMYFDQRTPETVCNILSRYCHNGQRLRLYYGDTITGECWMDEYDTIGYIGRSCGSIKIPLLIKNTCSTGGGAILDHCIIRITAGGVVVYSNPAFHFKPVYVENNNVYMDGSIYATCKNTMQAERIAAFLLGKRNTKGGKIA